MNETNHTIPYEVDYYGSIQALIRLEDTYLLTPSDVRKGEYKNWKAFRALNGLLFSFLGWKKLFNIIKIRFRLNQHLNAFKLANMLIQDKIITMLLDG